MRNYEAYLIIFIFINLQFGLSSGFIFTQLNRSLSHADIIKFSLVTESLNGIIFYGFDSSTQYLIELTNNHSKNILRIINQGFMAEREVKNICNINSYNRKYHKYFYWEFSLLPKQMKVSIKCNRQKSLVILNGPQKLDLLRLYPYAEALNIHKHESLIWMGKIYNNNNFKYKISYKTSVTLLGCVDKFYYNNKQIKFENSGTKFLSECKNQYSEIECRNKNCRNKSISYSIDNCSLSALNRRFCWVDDASLPFHVNPQHFYVINNNANIKSKLIIKFKWHHLTDFLCLMQIKTRKKSLIVFSLNQNQEIVLSNITSDVSTKKILPMKATKKTPNVLLMEFSNRVLIIKMFINDSIRVVREPFSDHPESIETGTCDVDDICEPFIGKMELLFDPLHVVSSNNNNKLTIIFVSCVVSIATIFIVTAIYLCKCKKNRFNIDGSGRVKNTNSRPQMETNIINEEEICYSIYKLG